MRLFKISWALLLPVFITACAHNAKKECSEADYYQMGFDDGEKGKDQNRLTEARDRCAKEGVPVADGKYIYGYKVGLAEFCDEKRGKSDANDLKPHDICLREGVPPYVTAFNEQLEKSKEKHRKEIAKLEEKKTDIQNEQNNIQNELNKVDQQKASEQAPSF